MHTSSERPNYELRILLLGNVSNGSKVQSCTVQVKPFGRVMLFVRARQQQRSQSARDLASADFAAS